MQAFLRAKAATAFSTS